MTPLKFKQIFVLSTGFAAPVYALDMDGQVWERTYRKLDKEGQVSYAWGWVQVEQLPLEEAVRKHKSQG